MYKKVLGVGLAICCVVLSASGAERQPADRVDPLMGIGDSRWMMFPGATVPLGFVQVSPDNRRSGWKSGYESNIREVAGFGHLHHWAMGGGVRTMPLTGEAKFTPGKEGEPDTGYRSRIRNDSESATPGYYAVTLDDYDVRAELTATSCTSFQRYTFPKSDQSHILIDLNFAQEYPHKASSIQIRQINDFEVAGVVHEYTRGINCRLENDYEIHFVARSDKKIKSFRGFNHKGSMPLNEAGIYVGLESAKNPFGGLLSFKTQAGEVVQLKVGLSLVSEEQARLNLQEESDKLFGWDFEACRKAAFTQWNELLSRVQVEGRNEEDLRKFYTNLYRVYSARGSFSDVNGKYRNVYEGVSQVERPGSDRMLGCDSLWHSYTSLQQAWQLISPEITCQWVRSFLEMYKVGGWLPKGPTGIEYSGIMTGNNAVPIIAAAYQAGIRDYDVNLAYEAMKHVMSTPGRYHEGGGYVGSWGIKSYMDYGYVPVEAGWRWSELATSDTLVHAYEDYAVSQMAKALGDEENDQAFTKRSQNYRKIFDPSIGYFRPRYADGRWLENFDPKAEATWFCEGSSMEYTWSVQHDVPGLIELLGGEEAFCDRLIESLEVDQHSGRKRPICWTIMENESNRHAPWMFNHAGKPWLTQMYTRRICNEYYGLDEDAWPGDEDQGKGGSWFSLAAMGLFQLDAGISMEPQYEIGSPLFDKVTIHLSPKFYSGKTFTIEARNNEPENYYIQSATLNGKPLNTPFIPAKTLLAGGQLVLEMGSEPNKEWGVGE